MTLYNRERAVKGSFYLPVSIIAPFGNRIFREIASPRLKTTHEPWYAILSHKPGEKPVVRSPEPVGPTYKTPEGFF